LRRREKVPPLQEELLDILHEPVGAILAGDVHCESGKLAAGVVKENFGHRNVDDFACAF
jgi:hypothetical protein